MKRDPSDVIQSFRNLFARNNRTDFDSLGVVDTFNYSLAGLRYAESTNDDQTFLFVEFDDLITDPDRELDRIYSFLDIERFAHDLDHIVNETPEDDAVYGLSGMHDVRPQIARRDASL